MIQPQQKKPSRQSGNILVYIIGAIFLLGLLVVIVKGSVQPGANIDPESLTLRVSEVRKYANKLERGVNFVMSNGVSESDIRFAHPNAISTYGTYGTNPKAEVFHPNGGGVEWKDPPKGIQASSLPWIFTGSNRVKEIGCNTAGDIRCVDLIAFLPDVTKAFCIALNESVGVTNPSGNPPKESDYACTTPYAGTFTDGCSINSSTPDYIAGHLEACFEGKTGTVENGLSGHYYYYKVLLAR